MKKVKIGINGMGRIGRTILREHIRRNSGELEIVAVNNPGTIEEYAHLLKYDSLHGNFKGTIIAEDGNLVINGNKIRFFTEKDPTQILWSELGVEIVLDATGIFKDKPGLSKHMNSKTVKKVIMCAPGKDLDATFVMGVNSHTYNPEKHHIISNASCTTNCLAPVAKVLHEKWKIVNGFMTTIHSYTSDQSLLDASHSDPRRARAAALSMIPTTTGAAKAVGEVIPELKGKLDGSSIRVPTPNVSLVDLTCTLETEASVDQINNALKEASNGSLKGILDYTSEELVSVDFMGCPASSTVDSKLTNKIGKTIKVVAWYDNETGFSNRVLDLATMVGAKL